jgi:hypothetical protein
MRRDFSLNRDVIFETSGKLAKKPADAILARAAQGQNSLPCAIGRLGLTFDREMRETASAVEGLLSARREFSAAAISLKLVCRPSPGNADIRRARGGGT